MTLEQQLEAARDAAAVHTRQGERVAAVMASEPGLFARVYLIAFERDGELAYLALDAELEPLDDRRLVREAVVMLGLAERAEEVSTALEADRLQPHFADAERALRGAGHEREAQAAADVQTALAGLSAAAAGPRVATPAYLDAIGAASGRLAVALLGYRDLAEQLSPPDRDQPPPAAEAAWRALAAAGGAGDPSQFSHAMTATTGAVEALADDVLGRLRPV